MKNFKWASCFAILCIANLLSSCKGCNKQEEAKLPDVAVNADFEMNPPIAREVTVQKMMDNPNGNMLLVADFGQGIIKEKFHALELSDGKVTLRDDGQGGDAKASDGLFSILLSEDLAQFEKEALAEADFQKSDKARPQFAIDGRHLVPPIDFIPFQFEPKLFDKGNKVKVPRDLACEATLSVSEPHSLFITNLGVVEDPTRTNQPCDGSRSPNGAWTFERLVTNMANGTVNVQDFVKNWLQTWLDDQIANTDIVPQRGGLFTNVIKPWVINSGGPAGVTEADWRTNTLDMNKAPFKLLAIVNRLDLRGNMGYGMTNSGEGRFVFEVLNPNDCRPLSGQFTVIFEYGIPITGCNRLKQYGQDWYDLKNEVLGSAVYNTKLEAITRVFTDAGAGGSKPNGSALNQIRTDERALGGPWELREFKIDAATHFLKLETVKQEPAQKFNQNSGIGDLVSQNLLRDYINVNEPDILLNKHVVPEVLPTGQNMLGAKARSEDSFWASTGIVNPEARHHFSFNTCTGCHLAETGTGFVHLSTVDFGTESVPSRFLTGITLPDPVVVANSHTFDDLFIRAESLKKLICNSCGHKRKELIEALLFRPNRMPH